MDTDALAALEFPAIAERVARAAATEAGRALARALAPSADTDEVARRQSLTAEGVALLDHAAEPPLDGIDDVRDPVARAAMGAVLPAAALRAIANAIEGALRARAALEEHAETAPLLAQLASPIERALAPLAESIGRAVELDGADVRDTASSRLRKLRAELRTGRQRVRERLEQLVRSGGLRDHLQEDFVTVRGGRPVLAVKATSRRGVAGIVHDASDSRQTLFVEPLEVVELNNRQSEAAAAECEEVERILRDLSAEVGESAAGLTVLVEAIGEVDLVLALATVSRGWRGAPVQVADE